MTGPSSRRSQPGANRTNGEPASAGPTAIGKHGAAAEAPGARRLKAAGYRAQRLSAGACLRPDPGGGARAASYREAPTAQRTRSRTSNAEMLDIVDRCRAGRLGPG